MKSLFETKLLTLTTLSVKLVKGFRCVYLISWHGVTILSTTLFEWLIILMYVCCNKATLNYVVINICIVTFFQLLHSSGNRSNIAIIFQCMDTWAWCKHNHWPYKRIFIRTLVGTYTIVSSNILRLRMLVTHAQNSYVIHWKSNSWAHKGVVF